MRRSGLGFAALAFACTVALSASALASGGTTPRRGASHVAVRSSIPALKLPARLAPSRATWTSAGTMHQAEEEAGGGAAIGTIGYTAGGITAFNPDGTIASLYDKMQIYNSTSNVWSIDNQPMPASTGGPLADGAQCTDGTHVYFINGIDQSFLYAALQIWDRTKPAGQRWSFGTFPQVNGKYYASQASGCVVLGGKVYLFG